MSDSLPNKLCLWRYSVLYLGDSFDPQMHSHHAVQCCIALEGMLRIRWEGEDGWQSCQAAVIGSNVPHSITNPDGPLCLVYLEKASNSYRSILDYHCVSAGCTTRATPLILDKPVSRTLCETLLTAMSSELWSDRANELKRACLKLFHDQISEPQPLDHRISLLLNNLHEQPGRSFSGVELADLACLSESRMQHLFKQQIGIPIRRYILWVRLRHVLELALAGATLTTASHESGFSDSAHFTRTFKAMYGIAPSALLAGGAGLAHLFCEREGAVAQL